MLPTRLSVQRGRTAACAFVAMLLVVGVFPQVAGAAPEPNVVPSAPSVLMPLSAGATSAAGACTPKSGSPCFTRAPETCPDNCPAPPSLSADYCGFKIDISIIDDGEYANTLTFADDGTVITRITGPLKLSFKNDVTGKEIRRNVSGSTTTTVVPTPAQVGGFVGLFEGEGDNWLGFGPNSHATGEPGLVFTAGLVVVKFNNLGATGFALGPGASQVDGCKLLGPQS